MTDEAVLLKKRFTELANRAYTSGIFTFTSFLGLSEQSAFSEVKRALGSIPYAAFGGAVGTFVQSVTLFSVLIYELVGPYFTKMALIKAGDIQLDGKTTARLANSSKADIK